MSVGNRGFTLIELMMVIGMSGLIAGVIGNFYLEARRGYAATEARLVLEREASLASEWLGRDIRGARSVSAAESGLIVDRPPRTITYTIEDDVLYRDEGDRLAIAPAVGIQFQELRSELIEVTLRLERPLGSHNEVSMTRRMLIGKRR